MLPLEQELRRAGKLLPEASDANIIRNSQVLVAEFKRRYPKRDLEVINAMDNKERLNESEQRDQGRWRSVDNHVDEDEVPGIAYGNFDIPPALGEEAGANI